MEHRKGGAAAIVIGIVAVAVIGLGVWYVVSPRFSTAVDSAMTSATQWTPEAISADPVGYLTWAGKKVEETEKQLKASELSLQTKKNQAEQKMKKAEAEIGKYETFVKEAIATYKEAKAANSFPVTMNGVEMTEDALKSNTMEAKHRLDAAKELQAAFQRTKNIIDKKLGEVKTKKNDIVKMKTKLETDLEIAKANKTVDGIDGYNAEIDDIVATSNALAGTTTDNASLDEVMSQTSDQQVDDQFEALLAE